MASGEQNIILEWSTTSLHIKTLKKKVQILLTPSNSQNTPHVNIISGLVWFPLVLFPLVLFPSVFLFSCYSLEHLWWICSLYKSSLFLLPLYGQWHLLTILTLANTHQRKAFSDRQPAWHVIFKRNYAVSADITYFQNWTEVFSKGYHIEWCKETVKMGLSICHSTATMSNARPRPYVYL